MSEEVHNAVSMANSSRQQMKAEAKLKKAKAAKEKEIREKMDLATACDDMSRIVRDIMIPEFMNITHIMIKSGYTAEVVAYDAPHPIYPDEMTDLGVKFRCGNREDPCKFEYIGNPEDFEFNLTVRDPNGRITKHKLSFQSLIPRNIRTMVGEFLDEHFLDSGYTPIYHDYDRYEQGYEGPFRIQMDDNGKISDIATTDTMEEAIKMGATFTSMFKGKPLSIVDKEGLTVC